MANVRIHTKHTVKWHATRGDRPTIWVGICDDLSLTLEADSLDELHGLIDESTQLLLCDLFRDGELHQFLAERGWSVDLRDRHARDLEFELPWELVVEGEHDHARRGEEGALRPQLLV